MYHFQGAFTPKQTDDSSPCEEFDSKFSIHTEELEMLLNSNCDSLILFIHFQWYNIIFIHFQSIQVLRSWFLLIFHVLWAIFWQKWLVFNSKLSTISGILGYKLVVTLSCSCTPLTELQLPVIPVVTMNHYKYRSKVFIQCAYPKCLAHYGNAMTAAWNLNSSEEGAWFNSMVSSLTGSHEVCLQFQWEP